MHPTSSTRLVSGFGRATASVARVVDVDAHDLADAVKDAPARGAIARGLGRSYGDSAQNGGGDVLRLASDRERIEIDPVAHTVTAGGGVSIDELLAELVPRGWFVPVTPGTRFVTVGGAIASDIHGKNHHRDGSVGSHVTRLRLMLADTTVVELGPDRDRELFWATVGGMGLTGVIVDATIRLVPIRTSRMAVDIRRLGDLDAVMAHMSATDAGAPYSVAWIDTLARGRRLGRGVVTNAAHAEPDRLDGVDAASPLAYVAPTSTTMPRLIPPAGVINRMTVSAFNEVWYRRAPARRDGVIQSIATYFHPLDQIARWNRVYGRDGFVQYQFVVPFGADAAIHAVVEQVSSARVPIFLAVLKRFGAGNPAPLSFPTAGWTLALDIGARRRDLGDLLRALDRVVLDAGGRHYLAKDSHLTPADLRQGYARLDDWLEVRERVDPSGVWTSDQARRLGLTGSTRHDPRAEAGA